MSKSRFEESTHAFGYDGDVWEIDESCVKIHGGGSFYDVYCGGADEDSPGDPDDETRAKAQALADKYGMRITDAFGEWHGYSEYTPDPGDISVFKWERK